VVTEKMQDMEQRDEPLTLFALAHACWLYKKMTDDALNELHGKVGGEIPDIERAEHRQAVIEFLNEWGCRQFAKEYHPDASKEMQQWWTAFLKDLPPPRKTLLMLTPGEIDAFTPVFDDLKNRTASYKGDGTGRHVVTFGGTGAAKILFVLRMNVFLPGTWRFGIGLTSATLALNTSVFSNTTASGSAKSSKMLGGSEYHRSRYPKPSIGRAFL
jgi:hypothetical protein